MTCNLNAISSSRPCLFLYFMIHWSDITCIWARAQQFLQNYVCGKPPTKKERSLTLCQHIREFSLKAQIIDKSRQLLKPFDYFFTENKTWYMNELEH